MVSRCTGDVPENEGFVSILNIDNAPIGNSAEKKTQYFFFIVTNPFWYPVCGLNQLILPRKLMRGVCKPGKNWKNVSHVVEFSTIP